MCASDRKVKLTFFLFTLLFLYSTFYTEIKEGIIVGKKVIVFIFLIVIILGCIVCFSNVQNQKLETGNLEIKNENIIETNEFDEIRIKPEITTDKEGEELEIIEEIKEEPTKQILEEVKQEKQESKISSNKTQAKVEIPKQEKQEIQEEPKSEQIQVIETKQEEQRSKEEQVTEEIKEEKQEEIKVETPQEVPNVEEQEEIKEQEITEEYKTNDQMINKIKTIIENNETEDMKTYGYEIVVDSTIPELTNEFTFTEQRVINKITWKCGIIRIYARDYYFNGNHISTQCFII